MKRVGYIYDRMLNKEFILNCIHIATKDSKKRQRSDVKRVLNSTDWYVTEMQRIVTEMDFMPQKPHETRIYDASSQKYRVISSVQFFPDGLMHVMAAQAMMDVLTRGMSCWSCAAIPGRGTERVYRKLKKEVPDAKFACSLDVKSYYPSIPIDNLMAAFEHKIKDQKFLALIALIFTNEQVRLADLVKAGNWHEMVRGRRGLDIGYYLNQWAANFYLESVDRLLDESEYPFTRYMDNITILSPNKRKLRRLKDRVVDKLHELGLEVKGDWQIYRIRTRSVKAVGYQFNDKGVRLRKRNFLRMTRQWRKLEKRFREGKPISLKMARGFTSRTGQLKHCTDRGAVYVYCRHVPVLKQIISIGTKLGMDEVPWSIYGPILAANDEALAKWKPQRRRKAKADVDKTHGTDTAKSGPESMAGQGMKSGPGTDRAGPQKRAGATGRTGTANSDRKDSRGRMKRKAKQNPDHA